MADLLEQGMAAYEAGDYSRAIMLLGRLLDEDPTQIEAKLWLGASMVAQGESERAIFLFKRVFKESRNAEIQSYARQMLIQLGFAEEDLPEPSSTPATTETVPLHHLQPCEVSFQQMLQDLCLLAESDLEEISPWLQRFVEDVKVFRAELAPGFSGSAANIKILEGLLYLESTRRLVECQRRLQSFLQTPNRVREQVLGNYWRSPNQDHPSPRPPPSPPQDDPHPGPQFGPNIDGGEYRHYIQ